MLGAAQRFGPWAVGSFHTQAKFPPDAPTAEPRARRFQGESPHAEVREPLLPARTSRSPVIWEGWRGAELLVNLVEWSAARENLRTRAPVLRLVCVSIALTEAVRSRYVTFRTLYILSSLHVHVERWKPSFETGCTHRPRPCGAVTLRSERIHPYMYTEAVL